MWKIAVMKLWGLSNMMVPLKDDKIIKMPNFLVQLFWWFSGLGC